jgi:hypothetical protein
MSTSAKKVASNRINGQKSHGPTNTTSTRFNATKHGLLAAGITELDDAEGYRTILRSLIREKEPVGELEMFLVHGLALDMVRWPRARRFEADCITGELNPPTRGTSMRDVGLFYEEGSVIDPGLPAAIASNGIQQLVTLQRYESTIANRFFRQLHELERLQRMRQGEHLPAPVAVDVGCHAEIGIEESVAVVPAEKSTMDSVDGKIETEESCPAALGPSKALPGEEELS